MPRARSRVDNASISLKEQDTEEDYLDVDKPLPGQNYYCISFVSPNKVLEQKELYMYYHYERAFYKKLTDIMETSLNNLIEKSNDGNIDVADVIKIKKSVFNTYSEENVDFDKFKSKLEDFRFRDEERIGEVFDKQNNFNTSVRGVKVRGVFDTKREADIRASVLQRMDPVFDVFVGQIGFWCPWDPNPQKITDIEYMDNDLNKLVKEYKSNETKKDHFYNEQKTQRKKDALSAEDRLKHQSGLSDMREFQQQAKEQTEATTAQSTSVNNMANIIDTNTDTNTNTNTSLDNLCSITELKPEIADFNLNNDIINTSTSTSDTTTTSNCINNNNNNTACNNCACSSVINTENENENKHIITQSIDIGDVNSKEISIEQQADMLQSDDPWIQRKIQNL